MSKHSPREILQNVFGFEGFRGEQEVIIDHTLKGNDSLALLPTGMGKSLCYQIPARLSQGLTLVISPLIALMKDQVDQALKRGFKTAYINSSLRKSERLERYEALSKGQYELVYVTPERFRKDDFCQAIGQNQVSLLAIDEAHCISEWGGDFRPDYSRLGEIRDLLGNPPTIALTATATPDVQEDIKKQLRFKKSSKTFSQGIKRPNITISSQEVYGLSDKISHITKHRENYPGPSIVYFSLISTLEKASLELEKLGIEHGIYHGKLGRKNRQTSQEWFIESSDGLILATPAFGLGVDKPNIRSVIHAEIPASIEAYWQEIGRSGRDGKEARALVLYDPDDISIQMDFIKWANPEPSFISSLFDLITKNLERFNAEGNDYLREQLNYFNKRDFRVETTVNLLERWSSIQQDPDSSLWQVTGPIPEHMVDSQKTQQREKSQFQKLQKIVELCKLQSCRKAFIEDYFGLTSNPPCNQCDFCDEQSR
jgi:ATP-dependent DNA helicase RecQ